MAADELRSLGNCRFQSKDYVAAKELYRKALKADPHDALSWCNLAACDRELSQHHLALHSALQAVRWKQDWWKAHFRLGLCYRSLHGISLAAAHFTRAAALAESTVHKAEASSMASRCSSGASGADDEDLVYRLVPSPNPATALEFLHNCRNAVDSGWHNYMTPSDVSGVGGGKGLVAACDLAAGTAFLGEQALVSAAFQPDLCSTCFCPLGPGQVACPQCHGEVYCSQGCLSTAWARWHRIQCGPASQALRRHAAECMAAGADLHTCYDITMTCRLVAVAVASLQQDGGCLEPEACRPAGTGTDAEATATGPRAPAATAKATLAGALTPIAQSLPHRQVFCLARTSSGASPSVLESSTPSCASRLAQYQVCTHAGALWMVAC